MEATSQQVASQLQGGGGGGPKAAPLVGVIMGSDSDLATMKAAAEVLEEFGVPCEVTVVSAHRCAGVVCVCGRLKGRVGAGAGVEGWEGLAHAHAGPTLGAARACLE